MGTLYTNLPFKTYTVMRNDLIQNLQCSDVYRAFILSLTTDKNTHTTDTTVSQLACFIDESQNNYNGGKRSISFNDKLRATGLVTIEDIPSTNHKRHYTQYRFSPVEVHNYTRIGRSFYDTYNSTMELKLRGFLLKLFSVVEPHSCLIKLGLARNGSASFNKLAKDIHMSVKTVKTFIKKLEDDDLIEIQGLCLINKAEGLYIDMPKDKEVERLTKMFEQMIEHNSKNGHPLSRECQIYKRNKEDGFKGIENMRGFLRSLESGIIGRKKTNKQQDSDSFMIIL